MKKSLNLFIVLLLTSVIFANNAKNNKELDTPKAKDLNNHYGISIKNSPYNNSKRDLNIYAQKNFSEVNLNHDPSKLKESLIENLKAEKNPENSPEKDVVVASGTLSNLGGNSSKLVNPEIASPKLKVEATLNHPKIIEYADFVGYKNKTKEVDVLDKKRNLIFKNKVSVSEPEYKKIKEIVNLPTKHTLTFDLSKKNFATEDPFGDLPKKMGKFEEEKSESYDDPDALSNSKDNLKKLLESKQKNNLK